MADSPAPEGIASSAAGSAPTTVTTPRPTHALVHALGALADAVGWLSSTANTISHFVEDAVKEDERRQAYPESNELDADLPAVHETSQSAGGTGDVGFSTPSKRTYSVSPTILEFVNALSEHPLTFVNFPRAHQPFVMTLAQEEHARRLLEQSPPLAQLRFDLVPRKMKEDQFFRVLFQLLRNVARKVAAKEDDEAIALAAASPASVAAGASSPAVAASPVGPRASSLDFDEIDRLCGTSNLHGPRISLGGVAHEDDDDDDDEARFDGPTDQLLDAIVRQHRSHSVVPSPMMSRSSHAAHPSSGELDTSTTTDLGIPSDAELDAALLAETSAAAETTMHAQQTPSQGSCPVALHASEDLP